MGAWGARPVRPIRVDPGFIRSARTLPQFYTTHHSKQSHYQIYSNKNNGSAISSQQHLFYQNSIVIHQRHQHLSEEPWDVRITNPIRTE